MASWAIVAIGDFAGAGLVVVGEVACCRLVLLLLVVRCSSCLARNVFVLASIRVRVSNERLTAVVVQRSFFTEVEKILSIKRRHAALHGLEPLGSPRAVAPSCCVLPRQLVGARQAVFAEARTDHCCFLRAPGVAVGLQGTCDWDTG